MKQPLMYFKSGFRVLLVVLATLTATLPTQAQVPAWQTVSPLGRGNDVKNGYTVESTAADVSGNIYLTGSFVGTVSFGATTLSSAGYSDVFVAKWSTVTRSYVWALRIGGAESDGRDGSIAVSGSSIYVSNGFSSSITVGSTGLPGNPSVYTCIIKLTDTGSSSTFVWAQLIKGSSAFMTESVQGLAMAVSGNAVYVAGSAEGYGSHNAIVLGNLAISLLGSKDGFVAKLIDAGSSSDFVWAYRAGGSTTTDKTVFSQVTVQGNSVYLGGLFAGSATFGTTTFTTNSNFNNDIVVTKMTDAGTTASFTWAQRGTSPNDDHINHMAAGSTGVYVAGYTDAPTLTFGSTVLTNAGTGMSTDGYLVKFVDGSGSGSVGWAQRLGGTGSDYITNLAVSGSLVYMTGGFYGTIGFGATTLTSAGSSDIFVSKLTDAGTSASFAWTQQAGGLGHDLGRTLAISGTTLYSIGLITPPAAFGSVSLPASFGNNYITSLEGDAVATKSAQAVQDILAAYPNPARAKVLVKLLTPATTLCLTDAVGQVSRTFTLPVGTTEASLDLRGLPAGLYLLRTATTIQKLLIE